MAKIAKQYLKQDPWKIIEEGFHPEQSKVSESLFSLGNEYMGARAFFEEGYEGESLVGLFFNGIYETEFIGHPQLFKGIVTEGHFMINAANWLYTRILVDGEQLDLGNATIKDFQRVLDMKTGTLQRSFVWELSNGKQVAFEFERFISMTKHHLAGQKISIKPLSDGVNIELSLGVDFSNQHVALNQCFWNVLTSEGNSSGDIHYLLGETLDTNQRLATAFKVFLNKNSETDTTEMKGELLERKLSISLNTGEEWIVDRLVSNHTEKSVEVTHVELKQRCISELERLNKDSYNNLHNEHKRFWEERWNECDIELGGDPENQQGLRFCIFHLNQTYHGIDPGYGISAKGLTGEAYSGWTWWDTETYCLPFYLFTNPNAAKNLLMYRYFTLPQAIERAHQLDCEGARYPMATINGSEAVGTWQHGDLEIHVSVAVAYGIWHYAKITEDYDFLYNEGMEMLLQISRYYASRGQWAQRTGDFGFWGVMGPDEFAMMVHNNYYTNYMVKKAFEYTLTLVEKMKREVPEQLAILEQRVNIRTDEYIDWKLKAEKMRLVQDKETGVFEQHDGYFNMPHIDVKAIPDKDFPIYKSWAYVRIFRNDMIKQPDVILTHLFYSEDYTLEEKKVNFDFYEERCSHESSLSPAVHSILANELGMNESAFDYMRFASRLDLDNYNNNTHEGIHNTSMAATWLNMVYGFAGLRTDGEKMVLNPTLPEQWTHYKFKLKVRENLINIKVTPSEVTLFLERDEAIDFMLYGKLVTLSTQKLSIPLTN